MAKIFDFAMQFLELGVSVIPLYHRSKNPLLISWEPYKTKLSADLEIRQWFPTDWNNYGVVAGWQNLVIIDFDDIEYFNLWQLWCGTQDSDVQYIAERSFKVLTRRGIHVYLMTDKPASNSKRIAKKGGIDIQAQGKYVVGPGCVHPSGHVYEPTGDFIFPIVPDIESIMPLDLFPPVAISDVEFHGEPPVIVPMVTQYDAFAAASVASDVDLISKVKQSVRIENLFSGVQKSGVDGRWLKALCPFHDDAHPSFWIDTRKQLCGCNVCGMKPMDAINLYSRMHNISESLAVSELAREVGVWG
jgi:DNA primase (bacterial type)